METNRTKIIKPFHNCQDSEQVYQTIKEYLNKKPVKPLPLDTPIYENKIRFLCISDTHFHTSGLESKIPAADILIHAGDFCELNEYGLFEKIEEFNDFLGKLNDKIKYKVVIAGNHDIMFQNATDMNEMCVYYQDIVLYHKNECNKNPKELLTNCIYLEDSSINLYGIKIYGSPWQPKYRGAAFNIDRGEKILEKWNKIPDDTDVLITHGPPLGFGDRTLRGSHVGCSELLSTVKRRVKPKYHIFGHIHEGYGMWSDGKTTYINASTCNRSYNPINDPIIFDIDIPSGFDKNWSL